MPFKHDEERVKLIERLKKELPQNLEFEWNATGALTISQDDKSLTLDYTNPPYPKSDEDMKQLFTRIKSKFK